MEGFNYRKFWLLLGVAALALTLIYIKCESDDYAGYQHCEVRHNGADQTTQK
jgi:hypothetical protein